jgi:hypothetical protein
MGRRLMVLTERAGPTGVLYDERAEPSAADLVAYLEGHPDLGLQVMARVRVGLPWLCRRRLRAGGQEAPIAYVVPDAAAGLVYWWTDTRTDGEGGAAPTEAEAMAAADAALAAAGWALAGAR